MDKKQIGFWYVLTFGLLLLFTYKIKCPNPLTGVLSVVYTLAFFSNFRYVE